MYSFTSECILNASKNLANIDDKVGGLICILSTIETHLVSNKIYKINLTKLKFYLQKTFDISIQSINSNNEYWYIVLSKNWINSFFEKIIKDKIDLLSLAVFFLRRNSFDTELSEKEILDLFIDKFNLQTVRNIWFKEQHSFQIKYTQTSVEINQKEFYKLKGIKTNSGALKFNGTTIVASATELQRCAQIQTLYAGMDMNSILLLNKNDLSKSYDFVDFTNSLKSDATLSAESSKNLLSTKPFEQIIFYGVPGCGKSFKIDNEKTNGATDIQKQKVVFHPDYANSDFVGQIIPRMKETGTGESKKTVIEYSFKPGPFTTILRRALRDKEHQYFLLIEEINRGNAAAIFGDLFQLLDRDESGWSCSPVNNDDINFYIASKYEFWEENYSDSHEYDAECVNHPNGTEPFSRNTGIRLPPNLSIYATMNTNDQNVFTLDNAFNRRFKSEYISNKENPAIPEHRKQFNLMIGETEIRWGAFRNIINEKILQTGLANAEDKQLGLFFIKSESGKTEISEKGFADKVLKYLWHDVFKRDKDIFNGEAEITKFEDLIDNFKGSKAFENCFDGNFVGSIKEINKELENE